MSIQFCCEPLLMPASGEVQGNVMYTRLPVGLPRTDPFHGLYLGAFGPHGPELLYLNRDQDEDGSECVVATKLTGKISCIPLPVVPLQRSGQWQVARQRLSSSVRWLVTQSRFPTAQVMQMCQPVWCLSVPRSGAHTGWTFVSTLPSWE